ncbi:hypothetical protein PPERSA_13087 [Pseudocohnilembus persalinus]|uniref:Protein MAK16 homolog n=1 Tax=Pseudocohnilembus persalinus TaxID=266149 RepID=A0A0V0QX67_PSEPJ|nr:hypothetical protein PPERSA_13087 [Pseudocohnilembus persalinus]|eukprot:KRX06608.1 hypothetical protein PPERSA_13087 [Pseudocohnilembus persalinus]
MQIDEVVWQIINQQNCSYKVPTVQRTFCRNEHNVTGFCNRQSCPLANSQYATIQHDKGVCYLMVKTIERSHTPKDMWEKIKLDKNYQKALEQIDKELQYWPKFMIHKNKQRLTKLRQMLIRIRKLKLKGYKEAVPVKQKAVRRDKVREHKAEIAAHVEETIEQELLDRLQSGVYEDLYANLNPEAFNKVLDDQQLQEEELENEEEDINESELDSAEYIFDPNQVDEDSGEDDYSDEGMDFGEEGEEGEEFSSDDEGIQDNLNQKRKGVQLEDSEDDEEQQQQNKNSKGKKPQKKVKTSKKGKKVLNYEIEQEKDIQQQQEMADF